MAEETRRDRPERRPWLCRSCQESFASRSGFDAHRVGDHEHVCSFEHPDGRRCLHVSELLEFGWTNDPARGWRRPVDESAFAFFNSKFPRDDGAEEPDDGDLVAAA